MGLFKPKAIKLYQRGDFRGLVGLLDQDPQTSVEAARALTIAGERAIPYLLPEIPRRDGAPFHTEESRSGRTLDARLALAGMGPIAVPYLFQAIREGDANMAWGAANCFALMEIGGWCVLDVRLPPLKVDYPEDVRLAYERKVGRPFRPSDTRSEMSRKRGTFFTRV